MRTLLASAAREFTKATCCDISANPFVGQTDHDEGLVAMLDSQCIGTLSFRVRRQSAHVFNVAVQPDYRRQGVARRLFGHLERVVIKRGVRTLQLQTVKETGAADAYLRLGFTVKSVKPEILLHSAGRRELSTVYMVKRLPLPIPGKRKKR